MLSPWPEEADANGVKVRNIAYTLSLGYSIGPKYSPSTERQVRTMSATPVLLLVCVKFNYDMPRLTVFSEV